MTTGRRTKPTTSGWGTPTPGDVLKCLEELGMVVTKLAYNEAWSYCPGHERLMGRPNRKPNKWSVNIETGIHSCFSCGFSGSFVTLVQEVLGYDRADAESWVRGRGGVARVRRVLAASADRWSSDEGLSQQHAEWNEARLAVFSAAPSSARAGRRVSSGSLSHYGILWSDGDDPFWVLPIRDPDTGRLWGYQEKSEDGWVSNKPYGVQKSLALFGYEVFDSPFVLVLESPLDCAVALTHGFYGAVSTYGAKISDTQLSLLLDLGVPIIFGLDNDDAGIKASLDLKHRFLGSGHRIKFLNYSHIPSKKDVGSDLTRQELQQAVLNAVPLVKYRHDFH